MQILITEPLSRQTFHARFVSFEDATDKRRVFGQHCLQTLEVWAGLTVALCLSTFPVCFAFSVTVTDLADFFFKVRLSHNVLLKGLLGLKYFVLNAQIKVSARYYFPESGQITRCCSQEVIKMSRKMLHLYTETN